MAWNIFEIGITGLERQRRLDAMVCALMTPYEAVMDVIEENGNYLGHYSAIMWDYEWHIEASYELRELYPGATAATPFEIYAMRMRSTFGQLRCTPYSERKLRLCFMCVCMVSAIVEQWLGKLPGLPDAAKKMVMQAREDIAKINQRLGLVLPPPSTSPPKDEAAATVAFESSPVFVVERRS